MTHSLTNIATKLSICMVLLGLAFGILSNHMHRNAISGQRQTASQPEERPGFLGYWAGL